MKISVDIDCTPEEARAFLGLPDMGPVHAVYLEKLQSFVRDGMNPADIEKMVRAWMPMTVDSLESMQKMFWSAATGGGSKTS